MNDIKGIIFDKDGTLFEFAATWQAWAQAFLLRASGNDRYRAAEVGRAIGFDFGRGVFENDSIVIAGTPEDIANMLAAHFPEMARPQLLSMLNDEAEDAPQVEAVPLVPLFKGLRSLGLALGVATNDAEAPATVHLQRAGVTDLLDFVAGSDSGYGGKPEPGQLLAFCDVMGLNPSEVVMVGDSTHDLRAGRAAGMSTVAVLTGIAQSSELGVLADVILPNIGHLPDWLKNRQE